jgi:hypothetical protein
MWSKAKNGLVQPLKQGRTSLFVSIFSHKSLKNPHVVSEWVKHVVKGLF